MASVQLKISELRKRAGVTQQELGDILGVSFQTISKWETGVTMPDITALPGISDYFHVSVDELLGLVPMADTYEPSDSGKKEYWAERLEYLKRTRNTFWNTDYMQFLVEKVWKLTKPVNILDCGCGFGFLGLLLLPMLPEGSTYTGIDFTPELLEEGKRIFQKEGINGRFLLADLYEADSMGTFEVVVSQAVLRHVNHGDAFLHKMISHVKEGGLAVSLETNREFEANGLYIEGMEYSSLCRHEGLKKLWKTEYEKQCRDYSIAMKIPHLMRKEGLKRVGVRMNDQVTYLAPGQENYQQTLLDIFQANHWDRVKTTEQTEKEITYFMNHGMSRKEAEDTCRQQNAIAGYLREHTGEAALTKFGGIMISYGWK